MNKDKILVTGGTGFIGSNLVHKLVDLGYKPYVLVRKESKMWRIKNILNKINLIETNILNYKILKNDLNKVKPSYIYHLAAYGAYQGTQQDIYKTFNTNIFGTTNLLEVCCNFGFKYFINTGSSSEYGIKNNQMKETDNLEPINFYGASKTTSTFVSKIYSLKYKLPIVTIRPFSPYGYYEEKIRFLPTLIINVLLNKEIKFSNSNYVRDFIFVEDLINAYLYFIKGNKFYGDIFNIGSGNQTKLGEIVNKMEKIIEKKILVKWLSTESNQFEPSKWQADIRKAKKNLSWKPKTSLDDGLKKSLEWFKNNLDLYR